MLGRMKIWIILIFLGLLFLTSSLCQAGFEAYLESVHNFLETEVDPIIWSVYGTISDLIESVNAPEDPMQKKYRVLDLNSRFIENVDAGMLFVITGKIEFIHDDKIGKMPVRVMLLSSDETTLQRVTVFCGNTLSEVDLAEKEFKEINRILKNDNNSELSVARGNTLPFMAVFSNFQKDQIERFSVEIKD